jgi:hypothetical protein
MEKRKFVAQRRFAVARFFSEHENDLVRQGSIIRSYRLRSGRRLGPYFKMVCRRGGRQRSVYLGSDEDFMEEVRVQLEQLQAPGRRRRELEASCRALRAQARQVRQALSTELAKHGLVTHGHEIRGWRKLA